MPTAQPPQQPTTPQAQRCSRVPRKRCVRSVTPTGVHIRIAASNLVSSKARCRLPRALKTWHRYSGKFVRVQVCRPIKLCYMRPSYCFPAGLFVPSKPLTMSLPSPSSLRSCWLPAARCPPWPPPPSPQTPPWSSPMSSTRTTGGRGAAGTGRNLGSTCILGGHLMTPSPCHRLQRLTETSLDDGPYARPLTHTRSLRARS